MSQSVSEHNRRSLTWMDWSLLAIPPLLAGALFYGQAQRWFSLADRDFESALSGCLLISVGVLTKTGASDFDSKARQFAGGCATVWRVGHVWEDLGARPMVIAELRILRNRISRDLLPLLSSEHWQTRAQGLSFR